MYVYPNFVCVGVQTLRLCWIIQWTLKFSYENHVNSMWSLTSQNRQRKQCWLGTTNCTNQGMCAHQWGESTSNFLRRNLDKMQFMNLASDWMFSKGFPFANPLELGDVVLPWNTFDSISTPPRSKINLYYVYCILLCIFVLSTPH